MLLVMFYRFTNRRNVPTRPVAKTKLVIGNYCTLDEAIRSYTQTGSFNLPENHSESYDYSGDDHFDYDAPVNSSDVDKIDAFIDSQSPVVDVSPSEVEASADSAEAAISNETSDKSDA